MPLMPPLPIDRFLVPEEPAVPATLARVRQDLVRGVPVADDVVRYTARLVAATRPGQGPEIKDVHKYISYGASPRASQYLVLGGKARAILSGRYHVDFADIKAAAHTVLRHRLVLNFHARADAIDSDTIIDRLLKAVATEELKR